MADIRLHVEGDRADRIVTELEKFFVQEFSCQPRREEQPVKMLVDEEQEEWTLMVYPVLALPVSVFAPGVSIQPPGLEDKVQRLIGLALYQWQRNGTRVWLERPDRAVPQPLDRVNTEELLTLAAA